jgi:protoheme IX farnesyltransferase
MLFFVWQVPHFWLLMLMHGDDYKLAGFPTLKDKIGELGLMRVIAIWCYLIIILAGFIQFEFNVSLAIWVVFIIMSIYLSYSSFLLLSGQKKGNKFFKIKFMKLNTFVLLNIIFLIINNFFYVLP